MKASRIAIATGWLVSMSPSVGCSAGPEEPACKDEPRRGEICIAGGEFQMGHDPVPEATASWDSPPTSYTPAHPVRLHPFFLDELPATNAQYLACVEAGACRDEFHVDQGFNALYSLHDPRLAEYPMATAYLEGAEEYCRWMGKRLPTEAEWERAARGPTGTDYPWGNDPPDCSRVLCEDDPPPFDWYRWFHHPVGDNPGDVSVEGVRELVTSVKTQTQDCFSEQFYRESPIDDPVNLGSSSCLRVERGRLWNSGEVYNGVTDPLPAWLRKYSLGNVGVRCARTDTGLGAPSNEAFIQARQRLLAGGRP